MFPDRAAVVNTGFSTSKFAIKILLIVSATIIGVALEDILLWLLLDLF